jgi:hypothetical protein
VFGVGWAGAGYLCAATVLLFLEAKGIVGFYLESYRVTLVAVFLLHLQRTTRTPLLSETKAINRADWLDATDPTACAKIDIHGPVQPIITGWPAAPPDVEGSSSPNSILSRE